MELIPITFKKIMQSRTYTVIVLGSEHKNFAIYTNPQVGQNIQSHLTEERSPRPFTHDLINAVFKGFEIKILQIVINDIEDTVYFARLFLQQEKETETSILEIDARPSDCITLALMYKVPLFCRRDVLDKAVPVEE